MDSELQRALAAAKALIRLSGKAQAAWLRRLSAPLPPALSDAGAWTVQALEAVAAFDPLAGLADYFPTATNTRTAGRAGSGTKLHSIAPSPAGKGRNRSASTVPLRDVSTESPRALPPTRGRQRPTPALSSVGGLPAPLVLEATATASDQTRAAFTTRADPPDPTATPLARSANSPGQASRTSVKETGAPLAATQQLAAQRRARARERHDHLRACPPVAKTRLTPQPDASVQAVAVGGSLVASAYDLDAGATVPVSSDLQYRAKGVSAAAVLALPGSVPHTTTPLGRTGPEARAGGGRAARGNKRPRVQPIEELPVQVVSAAISTPDAALPQPEDTLARQLADAAYRHGLDLT